MKQTFTYKLMGNAGGNTAVPYCWFLFACFTCLQQATTFFNASHPTSWHTATSYWNIPIYIIKSTRIHISRQASLQKFHLH